MPKYVELGQGDNRDVDLKDVKLVKLLPETEQLVIEPTTDEQNFKPSAEKYFDDVKVNAIKTESATVKSQETPSEVLPTQGHYFDKVNVEPVSLEAIEVVPTTNAQNINASEGFDAIKSVRVKAVNPSDYYKPEESIYVEPKTSTQTFNAPSGKVYNSVLVGAVTSEIDKAIIPTNIRKGKTILGVTGNLEADKPDQEKTVNPTTSQQSVVADTGYELSKVTVNAVTSSIDNNIKAENIKDGVSILGVRGTFEGGIKPSGTLNIENNGSYDVTNYANVQVNVMTTTNILEAYNVTIYTDNNGYNVLALNSAGEHNYVAGQIVADDNSTLYLVNI